MSISNPWRNNHGCLNHFSIGTVFFHGKFWDHSVFSTIFLCWGLHFNIPHSRFWLFLQRYSLANARRTFLTQEQISNNQIWSTCSFHQGWSNLINVIFELKLNFLLPVKSHFFHSRIWDVHLKALDSRISDLHVKISYFRIWDVHLKFSFFRIWDVHLKFSYFRIWDVHLTFSYLRIWD